MTVLTRESSRVLGVMLDLHRATGQHPTRREVSVAAGIAPETVRGHELRLAAAGALELPRGPELRGARLVPLERLQGLATRLHRPVEPCGTPAAATRHYRHGERPCPDCLAAAAQWQREHRASTGKAS